MLIVAIAWIFVVLLMSLAEALSSQGTVLGALITFVFYGALPLALVLYLLGTPMRRRAQRLRDSAQTSVPATPPPRTEESSAPAGDGRGHAAGDALATERKEP